MEAIKVRRVESGLYEIPGSATVEDWDDVRQHFDWHTVEKLKGWGWDECRSVRDGDANLLYFVREEADGEMDPRLVRNLIEAARRWRREWSAPGWGNPDAQQVAKLHLERSIDAMGMEEKA